MTYLIKEIFYTLQGEGGHAGRPAVFCRFSRCNLWTGRERDRSRAICQFCDTDFVGTDGEGGGRFRTAQELAEAVEAAWPTADQAHRFVVCTGGEPLLQLDEAAIDALHERGFEIAVETNGTRPPPAASTGCASARRSAPPWPSRAATNSNSSTLRPVATPPSSRGWTFATLGCNRWMMPTARPTLVPPSSTA